MFLTLFGYWAHVGGGGSPNGLVHNLLMQFFTVDSSKIIAKVCKVCFRPYLCSFHPILGVCCSGYILCEVDLPKAIEFWKSCTCH